MRTVVTFCFVAFGHDDVRIEDVDAKSNRSKELDKVLSAPEREKKK
jgi:hypothetical protein